MKRVSSNIICFVAFTFSLYTCASEGQKPISMDKLHVGNSTQELEKPSNPIEPTPTHTQTVANDTKKITTSEYSINTAAVRANENGQSFCPQHIDLATIKPLKIDNIVTNQVEKNWFEFGAREFLMLLMFISSIGSLSLSYRISRQNNFNRMEDKFQSEVDDFWFKEVVTPKFITPIFVCLEKNFAALNLLNFKSKLETRQKAIQNLTDDLTILHLSINILLGVPNGENFTKKTKYIFEHLEDQLQIKLFPEEAESPEEYFSINSMDIVVQQLFSETQVNILLLVSELRESLRAEIKQIASMKKN